MYISVSKLKNVWKVSPEAILHVGAHQAEEYEDYLRHGWIGGGAKRAIWVEAQSGLSKLLREKLPLDMNEVLNFAIWHEDSLQMDLNIASNSQSSSLFEFEDHTERYPTIKMIGTETVTTRRLDSILNSSETRPDFLNLDIQGAELIALQSLGAKIDNFKWVYTEVNFTNLYAKNPLIGEIDRYLQNFNFKRVVTHRVPDAGWGDALYIRRGVENGGLKAKVAAAQIHLIYLYAVSINFLKQTIKNSLFQN
jgi:FkbM family methyltransferase